MLVLEEDTLSVLKPEIPSAELWDRNQPPALGVGSNRLQFHLSPSTLTINLSSLHPTPDTLNSTPNTLHPTPISPRGGIKSSFSVPLICTASCQIQASASTNHGPGKRPLDGIGVPRSLKTATLPRTTIGPWAYSYCRVLGGRCFL